MMTRIFTSGLVLFALLLVAETCVAHKVTVFGYVDQGMVKTEAKFSGGRAAKHCQLSMVSESEPVLLGETDGSGMFDFPVPPAKTAFDLVVTCGDGHRGVWRIEANELVGASSVINHEHQHSVAESPVSDTESLRRMIRAELQAELGPLKKQLAELKQETVTLADIMGGIGYFLGLAGLVSYMRFRKGRKES